MKRCINLLILLTWLPVLISAQGVFKKTKTEVTFTDFGTYTVNSADIITPTKKRSETDSRFKGDGFMKNLVTTLIFPKGNQGQIFDIENKTTTMIDHEESEYRVMPLKQIDLSAYRQHEMPDTVEIPDQPQPEEPAEIRIIRNEFSVTESGRNEKINKFESKEFIARWIIEWEVIETGERNKDSLRTEIWTTRDQDRFANELKIEQDFAINFAGAQGIDYQHLTQDVLGSKWTQFLAELRQQGQYENRNQLPDLSEIEKIDGYPVRIAGSYFVSRPALEKAQAEAKEEKSGDITNPRKMLGGFAKKKLFGGKKEEPKGEKPAFSWLNELKELKPYQPKESDWQVSKKYKRVER